MCGIIGYVGHRDPVEILLCGLRQLEYRGYDSAGIAWRETDGLRHVRAVGNLDSLDAALLATGRGSPAADPALGIAHTRWATHGAATADNAHPHADSTGRFLVALNGIVENHVEIRRKLTAEAIVCRSQTDAEVVAHLVGLHYDGDLSEAVRRTTEEISGHYALVAICADHPDTLVGVRRECPLVVGIAGEEKFVASSTSAFDEHARDIVVLDEQEVAVLRPDGLTLTDRSGRSRRPRPATVDRVVEPVGKNGFDTFMRNEIDEQSAAISQTLAARHFTAGPATGAGLSDHLLRRTERMIVIACGSSYNAGLAGQLALERWARMPVDVAIASEFRYRDPIIEPQTLVLGVTQSGETADTLAAMRLARARGATVVAVTNVASSQASREADATLLTRAGTERGVAATKTFAAQVVLLYEVALHLAELRGTATPAELRRLRADLRRLPRLVEGVVGSAEAEVAAIAHKFARRPLFLFLGRLAGLPVAMEGALKLKEISYIPAEAYPAGEMKHGPIALLSSETPVIAVAIDGAVLPKLLSNVAEVQARGAPVVAIAGRKSVELAEHAEHSLYLPCIDPILQVPLAVVPLQLFAYHVARARALNVDRPRNLAKTVTVE
jgi:glucosamine--fructose-6-phosphate aminotransferase (isomerizing)